MTDPVHEPPTDATPTAKERIAYDQLREKIRGKIDVAKFFAGFVSLVFGFVFKIGSWTVTTVTDFKSLGAWAILPLLVASVAFALATMFAYDRLLIPTDPQQTAEDLKRRMIRAWYYLFMPAVASLLLGLVAATAWITEGNRWIIAMCVFGLAAAGASYARATKGFPQLTLKA